MNRQGLGLFKMLVLMVLMAATMLIGFGVYANWDEDTDGDGTVDGFTLRIFDMSWYGIAGDDARPLAQDAKLHLLAIRKKVMGKGGLLEQGGDVYEKLVKSKGSDASGASKVHTSDKPANKNKILHGNKNKTDSWKEATDAVHTNDPEGAYKFDSTEITEKPTLHIEDDILEAGERFAAGKAAYVSAYDHDQNLRDNYAEQMKTSQKELTAAKKLLDPAVAEYATRSDADPHMKKTSKRLLLAIDKLLADAYVKTP